ncbi:hypothetical protein [Noviherbaspirillum sp. UKPF54]|uniref:hypothetical protein n=1 Tax=Noviherbaspirillum sp. UKPF54 TaxID=2601898 RepID=UPI0011B1B838|nr:hypothetical protein [Noviherbaspirillum sp. UKPF54]QDZ26578.1 hypothetical protein FAY22_00500 [Noviherbaspirillum sp. UKPF54]
MSRNFSANITFKVAGVLGTSHFPIHGAPPGDLPQQLANKIKFLRKHFGTLITAFIDVAGAPTQSVSFEGGPELLGDALEELLFQVQFAHSLECDASKVARRDAWAARRATL